MSHTLKRMERLHEVRTSLSFQSAVSRQSYAEPKSSMNNILRGMAETSNYDYYS
jgi:hypothetical protein